MLFWYFIDSRVILPPDEKTRLFPQPQFFMFSLLDILPFTFLTRRPLLILAACPGPSCSPPQSTEPAMCLRLVGRLRTGYK